jgi:hypothetical protein
MGIGISRVQMINGTTRTDFDTINLSPFTSIYHFNCSNIYHSPSRKALKAHRADISVVDGSLRIQLAAASMARVGEGPLPSYLLYVESC